MEDHTREGLHAAEHVLAHCVVMLRRLQMGVQITGLESPSKSVDAIAEVLDGQARCLRVWVEQLKDEERRDAEREPVAEDEVPEALDPID